MSRDMVKCEYCGTEFDPETYPYACPNCHFGKGRAREEKRAVKELTDYEVRLNYERIVKSLLNMVKPFHLLIEGAPDPELRKSAGETWDAIREKIVCLRHRFGLAWVDSAQGEEKASGDGYG